MTGSINTALMLMVVGMGTVFLVLIFIIYFSKALIWFINRYVPEETASGQAASAGSATEIPSKITAAITAAVGMAYGGKVKIEKIERKK